MLLNQFQKVFFLVYTDKIFNHFTILEDFERGDTHDAVFPSQILIAVDINLRDDGLILHLAGKFIDDRTLSLTGAAPGCPEVDKYGLSLDPEYLTFKVVLCYFKRCHNYFC